MYLPVVFAALGAFFGFENPFVRFPPLVLLVPAALAHIGAQAEDGRGAFRRGYFAGVLSAALPLYWTALPVHDYGGLGWLLAVPCPVLISLVLGLYPALFCLVMFWATRTLKPWSAGLFAGLFWAGMELARGALLTGFPWLTLAAAFSPWPVAIACASLVGAYGLSGLYAAAACLCALGIRRDRWGAAAETAGLCLFALLACAGWFLLAHPAPSAGQANVSIIQGNVDQSQKWDKSFQDEILGRYLKLSEEEIAAHKPDLLVWPETALPFFYEPGVPDDRLSRSVKGLVRKSGAALLAGGPAEGKLGGRSVLYNRAYLLGPPDANVSSYDKVHLVPFGEYVPFGQYLTFIGKLVEGVGDFVPGDSAAPLRRGNIAMGVLICYEAIFPDLAQKRVEAGANILVNLSNDAWYGRSSAPRQHLDLAVLRAVEQGVWLIRATNTGISAAVDPAGRVIGPTALFVAASANYPQVGLAAGQTFFHRWYGLITVAIAAGSLMFAVLVWLGARGARKSY
jgi:apolipoprotein N-acyltransferase